MRETDLYPPVKAFLQGQGYEVKAEVGAADVVACRGDEPPVVVELKTGLTLSLIHQAIARQAMTDCVYVAVPPGRGPRWPKARREALTLCRRLGLGLLLVRPDTGHVEAACDPAPYRPRKAPVRARRLLREFARRDGDPNEGGRSMRSGALVTAYRQDALRLARHLAAHGPSKGATVAAATGVGRATRVMADDYYGWFERVSTGVYALTAKGRAALGEWSGAIESLSAVAEPTTGAQSAP